MRWMMYRWWCEGGADRAWWVIESVFHQRCPATWVPLCNLMLKLRGISHSSAILGSDSRHSNNRKGNSIHSTGDTHCQTLYCRYLRLPRPTPAPALMQELHNWHRCWAEEPGYTTGNPTEDYGQIRGGCSFQFVKFQTIKNDHCWWMNRTNRFLRSHKTAGGVICRVKIMYQLATAEGRGSGSPSGWNRF